MTSEQLTLLLRYINARAEYVRRPSGEAALLLAEIIGELEATVEDTP